ncbi:hypothetical protein ETD86_50170 [Nonomuraea turkmeniaca]|uniref:Transposase n=1 Tax=Nonomuraea turkmeniaca TaxID=103838 RepID=A0A5S4EW81_9ACTN|nr:hypothetical protein [Nonomuraea turkmeniaca]TMR07886.1 hypothetical protein ETD86_50170 [Nonomuraea turkmeniaca]
MRRRRLRHPVGQPITIPTVLTGPASQRDGRLRQTIGELIHLAGPHGCAGVAIENLGFDHVRATGRETMGRGWRGKSFRRTVAGIPTARFRERLRGMAYHRGLRVIAVDPACTSKWGGRHRQRPLLQQTKQNTRRDTVTGIMVLRWRSDDAPSDTGSGVRQV